MLILSAILAIFVYGMIAAMLGTILPDLSIACGVGSLQLLTLQPQNKKPMDLRSFANGHPFLPGSKIRSVVPIQLSS